MGCWRAGGLSSCGRLAVKRLKACIDIGRLISDGSLCILGNTTLTSCILNPEIETVNGNKTV
jgi:hypothetical protein